MQTLFVHLEDFGKYNGKGIKGLKAF